jgi:hypothetical protein
MDIELAVHPIAPGTNKVADDNTINEEPYDTKNHDEVI